MLFYFESFSSSENVRFISRMINSEEKISSATVLISNGTVLISNDTVLINKHSYKMRL